jgi:hypothetical protein
VKLTQFSGEQIVPVTSPDPFARPVLRSPALHVSLWLVGAVRLCRWSWRCCRSSPGTRSLI